MIGGLNNRMFVKYFVLSFINNEDLINVCWYFDSVVIINRSIEGV